MSLAIAICATKNFTYAMCEQLRRVVANLRDEPPGHVILSGDSSPELKAIIAEYQRLMRDDLIKSRLSSLEIVETNIQATSLTEGDMVRWMQAINDARLVLGTILDVSEDDDRFELDEDDPEAQAFNLFHYLGGLLDDIVTALSPS